MTLPLKRLGLALLLLLWYCSGFAVDSDQLYQIEVMIFSHITEEGLRSEYWPLLPQQTIQPTAIELPDDQILPESQWVLKPAEQLLKHSHYVVLLHLAWQESATDARKGEIIHLAGGETYPGDLHQVDGTVAVRLERYFSLHVNLRFTMPWQNIQDLNLTNMARDEHDPYVSFKINERLRMRSNELNYIDHPLYGVLIKIIPLPTAGTNG